MSGACLRRRKLPKKFATPRFLEKLAPVGTAMPFTGKVHHNVLTVMEGHQELKVRGVLLHAAKVPFLALEFDVNEIAALDLQMMQLRLCAGLTSREDPLQGPAIKCTNGATDSQ